MMKTTQNQAPTFESVWALIDKHAQERVESEARFDRELEKSRIEWEKKMAESDARWDKERKESEAKFDRGLEKSREEWEKKMAESRAEWDKKMTESRADHERRTKKLEELTGSWTHNHGSFAEEYFFNSFENGNVHFFGEKFDDILKKVTHFKRGVKGEYDIVLYNHTSVALIEVKYKAHLSDITKVLKYPETFRFLFPDYNDFKIYLCLASLSFYHKLEEACLYNGIAIVKQVGNSVVINDKNLKVF